MTELSCLAFARANHSGGTLLGTEFLGWSIDQLHAELKRLKTTMPGRHEGAIAADVRAGGKQRVTKLEMITSFMASAGVDTWTHAEPENSFQKAIRLGIEREHVALGKMPQKLADLHMAHATSTAQIDAAADALEAAILHNDEVETQVRDAVYAAGAGDKDFRHALDAADVRARIKARFADGVGQHDRDRNRVSDRVATIWNVVMLKFRKKAA